MTMKERLGASLVTIRLRVFEKHLSVPISNAISRGITLLPAKNNISLNLRKKTKFIPKSKYEPF
jgi:hypothetical protein